MMVLNMEFDPVSVIVFKLKKGDKFIFPDHYVNSNMIVVKHNYHCIVMYVVVENDVLEGFLIKRYLKTRRRWSYEFFDYYKMLSIMNRVNHDSSN